MRFILQIITGILLYISVPAQTINQATTGNTYAIIIGVARYLDPDIPQLQFSNRDAVAFADYLMSASGGSVPKQQIRLLTDSAATIGEVDKTLRWVLNNCKENDRVYFYFSGHGEMENVTMSKNGYLICYNTPAVAFVNMGLSIDYLNDVVNTLSIRSRARVIVITDACHSGTVAGSKFKGNFFVGEQLMLKKQNEIRMASSKPDQLSNEKTDWGGGRGVFSYYLLNGLQGGLADSNNDKMVNVGELKNYLEQKMANDPVLKNEGDVQTPVINGDAGFKMAKVVEAEAVKIQEQVKKDSINIEMVMGSVAPDLETEEEYTEPDTYFFKQLKKYNLEELTDSLELNKLNTDQIAFAIIRWLKNKPATETGLRKLSELEARLKNDIEILNRFNVDLSGSFLDVGQIVITNFINGDEAEMERRRYYNSKNSNYDVYVRMFEMAYKLSQSDKYYSTKAKILFHYFSGLALRIKIPLTQDPASLIEKAITEQKKALALEEHAAYIYNEMGYLYKYKNDYANAEKYYILANRYSPQWAIPLANLCAVYGATGKYQKATDACLAADSLKKRLHSVNVNLGLINEKKQNFLAAEEVYYEAIDINSRHYLPFQRLGYLNMSISDYAKADSFFYEADQRKKGFNFKQNKRNVFADSDGDGVTDQFDNCAEPTGDFKDIFRTFREAMENFEYGNDSAAEKQFNQVIALDKAHPLAFHYLGILLFKQKKWINADVVFKKAILNFLDSAAFMQYVDSVNKTITHRDANECAVEFFIKKQYGQPDDYYFTGALYENWQHIEEAEKAYKTITAMRPWDYAGYKKLWLFLEKQGRFTEAEQVINQYSAVNKEMSQLELNAFYRRIIGQFPDDGNWNYKLGLLLYNRASGKSVAPYFDSIVWLPLLNKEVFIDGDNYNHLNKTDSLFIEGNSDRLRGTSYFYEPLEEFELITGEIISIADHIYLPRKDCIFYLKRAAELLSEKEILADINFKIGKVYIWAGSKKQAHPYLEKSIALIPGNANARLTLIDMYTALFKNKAAFEQLDYLYNNKQIDYPKLLLFSKFNMLSANYDRGQKLLNEAEYIYPYKSRELYNLQGLSYMLANKLRDAIKFYELYVKTDTADTDTLFTTVAHRIGDLTRIKKVKIDSRRMQAYTLARLYAKTGKSAEALKWLETAINYGFKYSYVLQHDSYMESLRKTSKWQTMISGMFMIKYKQETAAN
jgi:Tfp pilus assembly protein PilF